MTFHLEPVTSPQADMPRLLEIQFAAFADQPAHAWLYPERLIGPAVERSLKELEGTPSQHIIKCVDDDGKIIGFTKWNLYKEERPKSEWAQREEVDFVEGEDKRLAETIIEPLCALRERLWEGRPHCLCSILAVDPTYQRHGVGTKLLRWGLSQANDLRLPAYLEATDAGYGLYIREGFHEVNDAIVIKAEQWGGEHDLIYKALIRDA